MQSQKVDSRKTLHLNKYSFSQNERLDIVKRRMDRTKDAAGRPSEWAFVNFQRETRRIEREVQRAKERKNGK